MAIIRYKKAIFVDNKFKFEVNYSTLEFALNKIKDMSVGDTLRFRDNSHVIPSDFKYFCNSSSIQRAKTNLNQLTQSGILSIIRVGRFKKIVVNKVPMVLNVKFVDGRPLLNEE